MISNSDLQRSSVMLLAICIASGLATAADGPWNQGPLACYSVPALSSIPRMPDTLPSDAQAGTLLRMVAAKGEFEPVSFVIAPRRDITKLELNASPLSGPGDPIPAERTGRLGWRHN